MFRIVAAAYVDLPARSPLHSQNNNGRALEVFLKIHTSYNPEKSTSHTSPRPDSHSSTHFPVETALDDRWDNVGEISGTPVTPVAIWMIGNNTGPCVHPFSCCPIEPRLYKARLTRNPIGVVSKRLLSSVARSFVIHHTLSLGKNRPKSVQ